MANRSTGLSGTAALGEIMNPFAVFAIVWAAVILAQALGLFYFYEPFSLQFSGLVAICMGVGLALVQLFPGRFYDGTNAGKFNELSERVAKFRTICLGLALLIFAYETCLAHGVPLYWRLVGVPKGYADFGVPSLHGLYNALILFCLTASTALLLNGRLLLRDMLAVVVCLLLIIMLLNRGMLFIFCIQLAGLVLLRIPKIYALLPLLILSTAGIFALFSFGVIGNARVGCQVAVLPEAVQVERLRDQGGSEVYQEEISAPALADERLTRLADPSISQAELNDSRNLISDIVPIGCNPYTGLVPYDKRSTISVIPAEFLWPYAYATTGLNNLLYNLPRIEPDYQPRYSLSKLLPTVLYNAWGWERELDSFTLVHPGFTVSTAFSGFVSDFGWPGVLLYAPFLTIAYIAFRLAKAGNAVAAMLYATLFQSIVLSPYIDTILYGPFLMQIILVIASGTVTRDRLSNIFHTHKKQI